MRKRLLLLAFLPFLFIGCASISGSPELPGYQQRTVNVLIKEYSKPGAIPVQQGELDSTGNVLSGAQGKILDTNKRNQIIEDLIFVIDVNYNTFERKLYAERASANTLVDLVSLSVTSASTLVGAKETKTILSAVATGITGGRAAVDKNFFQEQSTSAIITTMRTARMNELILIRNSEVKSLANYPMTHALTDLADYYNAGTLMNALGTIVSNAQEDESEAKDSLKESLTNSTK